MKKIIIWGYPLGSDTLSYVWNGFYRAFQALGYDVVWFHDGNYDGSLKDEECLFLCESYRCQQMPLFSKATYLVHTLIDDSRFLGRVKRVIDLRYNQDYQDHEVNYKYHLLRNKMIRLGPLVYFETSSPVDRLYMAWATDLLPHEIDKEAVHLGRQSKYSCFVGTIYDGKYSNRAEVDAYASACKRNNVDFIHVDPWSKPISDKENRDLVAKSYLAPDIRGRQNIDSGYIPCRIFKNISYGALGLTNSKAIHIATDEWAIYHPSPEGLFELGRKYRGDVEYIQGQMDYVKHNHTYISRIRSLEKIL